MAMQQIAKNVSIPIGVLRIDAYDIDSIVLAIKKAKELLSVNKGEENKMYAQTKWNTSAISRQLAEVYRCLKNE